MLRKTSLPHTSPTELNALCTASEVNCCLKGNRELLIQLRKVNTLFLGDPKIYLKSGISTPNFFQIVLDLQTSARLVVPLPQVRQTNPSRGPCADLVSVNAISISLCFFYPAEILRISKKVLVEENEFYHKLLIKCESEAYDIIFNPE